MDKILDIIKEYKKLELDKIKDFGLFNRIAIVHHSSGIEGSTLTLMDTQLLLTEGITPKGKPLEHSLMEKDHYSALLFTLEMARKSHFMGVEDLRAINAKVMASTGGVINSALGSIDSLKGEFRVSNVRAGDHYFIKWYHTRQTF